MIVKLENREYELKANGRFMKKYQETFNESLMTAMYKCSVQKDLYECAKLCYCAIEDLDMTFEEWLDSFETPMFMLGSMDQVFEFLTRDCKPTVEAEKKEESKDSKKKN